jgi:hypothetical protein
VKIAESVKVWTPDGYYESPTLIDMHKMPDEDLAKQIFQAYARNPPQRILTSGEWHQIRETAQKTNPELEKSMIERGNGYERTCTLLDYEHGELRDQCYDGFLIQIPEIALHDSRSAPVINKNDKGIVRGRNIWRMPLPLEPYYAKDMPKIFDMFLNTIYGTENAREKYPHAFVGLGSRQDNEITIPHGLIDIVRGWYSDYYNQASVVWGRSNGYLNCEMCARAAVEEWKR